MAPTEDPSILPFRASGLWQRVRDLPALQVLLGLALIAAGLVLGWPPLTLVGSLITLALALLQLLPGLWERIGSQIDEEATVQTLALLGLLAGLLGGSYALGWWDPLLRVYRSGDWEAIGAIGEGVVGAFGQILVAVVALLIAWRQFVVDRRLTTQQNRITQAQTIDSYIQGISDLVSNEEGMLEDWPLERMLLEGRTAAVLGSIDANGKAKVLRFLSHASLLTPLRRDARLGRAILDGQGGYAADRLEGVPVVRLHQMLVGADLSGTDLRGVDFNAADLRGCRFEQADLGGANLAGCNLSGANFSGARLEGAVLFLGRPESCSPAWPGTRPDLASGAHTGAIVENSDFTEVRQLSPEARAYCAAWSGKRSRRTIPGGTKGLPNQLELPGT
ncbi:MAG: pentapeptide repeat-containing protein [Cyanobacteriota bacterium]